MKTNKSYDKRLKVSKKGKILARKSGQNHFNAKASKSQKLAKKRLVNFKISNKAASRFLVNNK
jgi:ribosomal protein L35